MDMFDIRRAGIVCTATAAGAVVQIDDAASSGYTPRDDITIENPGPHDVRVRAGDASVEADETAAIVPGGFLRVCHKGSATHLALYSPDGDQDVVVTLGAGGLAMVPLRMASAEAGGGGDASAANQVTEIARLVEIRDKILAAPSTEAKQDVIVAGLVSIDSHVDGIELQVGATDETAPVSDTAAAGLNGRLQRIAQRLTSLIALLPASLGAKTGAASLSIVPASDANILVGGYAVNPTASFSRPADTTQYAVGDLVANTTTAGSVTPLSLVIARAANGSAMLRRLTLRKSGVSLTNAVFRVHLFRQATITCSNGDNGAFLTNQLANYIGAFDVTMDRAFTDGAYGAGVPVNGSDMTIALSGGVDYVRALVEARGAYPPASAETFTVGLEVIQN